jgi:competence CoiA-like predicted nuclease
MNEEVTSTRSNKIWEVIRDGEFIDCEYHLNNWHSERSKRFLASLRNDEVDADLVGKSLLLCPACEKPVKLRYQSQERHPYFKHHFEDDAKTCLLYDGKSENLGKEVIRARKYEGRKTGKLHTDAVFNMAQIIELMDDAELLREPDKRRIKHRNGSGQYRVPDLHFRYQDKEIVIEVQNSPEWVRVIAERHKFYLDNGIYLIWVFTTSKLIEDSVTSLDIASRQSFNTFIFDRACNELSLREADLRLECSYDMACATLVDGKYRTIISKQSQHVSLGELQYLDGSMPFFQDLETSKKTSQFTCDTRNGIQKELNLPQGHKLHDDFYYTYMLESAFFAKFGEFPEAVKQNVISRLNHLAHCYISAMYLYGALQRSGNLPYAYSFDRKGNLKKKFEDAMHFWKVLQESPNKAHEMFDSNQRISEMTVRGWRKTVDSEDNQYCMLFPDLASLNDKGKRLLSAIEEMLGIKS